MTLSKTPPNCPQGQDPRIGIFPEIKAGGYARTDTTMAFYTRVRSILTPEMSVLNFGAGRGRTPPKAVEGTSPFRGALVDIKSNCKYLAAVDIDPAVLENENCHDAHVIEVGKPLPFDDNSFDMIISDWVFEHVGNPEETALELRRVLKPAGWICARTPNKYGYVGIAASLIPNALHSKIVRVLNDGTKSARAEKDVFPTAYKMNRIGVLNVLFPDFVQASYYDVETLTYFQKSTFLCHLVQFSLRFIPRVFYPTLYVFMQKRL